MRPIFAVSPTRSTRPPVVAKKKPVSTTTASANSTSKTNPTKPVPPKYVPFKSKHPISGPIGKSRQQVQTAEIGVQTDVVLCDKQIQTGNGGATRDQAIQVIPGKLIHFSPTKIADSVAGLSIRMPESPILRTGRRENKLRSPIFSHQKHYSSSQAAADHHQQTMSLSDHEESVISEAKSGHNRRVVESPLEKELMEPLNFDESEDEQNEKPRF
uniref:Uncharacterized protein n=1 Tax=Ditylenchus dipsaci TaxID=166011 RepID=A0A915E0H2_9BILA